MAKASKLKNPHLDALGIDHLHHLGISSDRKDLTSVFGDVKFVCMCGSIWRAKRLAEYLKKELGTSGTITDLIPHTDRYDMYKVGPVLIASHGMGLGSMSIILNEVIKLLHYARCTDFKFFRIGTCGGLGIEPGSLVLTTQAVDALFRPFLQIHILGKTEERPTDLNDELTREIYSLNGYLENPFEVHMGKTMCALDFYEEQARLDGANCEYTLEQKNEYLNKAKEAGIYNIEMETLAFASLCKKLEIPAAVICVTLVNRLASDQVTIPSTTREEFEDRPVKLLSQLIRRSFCNAKQ